MMLDALLVVVVFVCLFVCFVIACHCKITAYVGDNKLILILSFSTNVSLSLLSGISACTSSSDSRQVYNESE